MILAKYKEYKLHVEKLAAGMDREKIKQDLSDFCTCEGAKISKLILDELFSLESKKQKNHEYYPSLDVQYHSHVYQLYTILSRMNNNDKYLQLPRSWMKIGACAGILKDLTDILRQPFQIGLTNKHLFSLNELMIAFTTHSDTLRFIFLDCIFRKSSSISQISSILKCAILSQGKCKDVGIHINMNDSQYYYYAIQDLSGDVKYDDRVVSTITCNTLKLPLYAIYFTDKENANNIYLKNKTLSPLIVKSDNGKPDLKIIQAMTGVEKILDDCDIKETKCFIEKFTSTKSASDEYIERRKLLGQEVFEAGLIIDVLKLATYFKDIGLEKSLLINEVDTLLILNDVPHDCIIELLSTEEELKLYWRTHHKMESQ